MPISAERRARIERIRDQARQLFQDPNLMACHALVALIEWVVDEYGPSIVIERPPYTPTDLVTDLGYVLTERSEWIVDARDEDVDLYLGYSYAQDSCFQSMFQDGSNQVRHFWGYVWMGSEYGWWISHYAGVREWFALEGADYVLGVRGADLGAKVAWGMIEIHEMADWVRRYICNWTNCTAYQPDDEEEDEEED